MLKQDIKICQDLQSMLLWVNEAPGLEKYVTYYLLLVTYVMLKQDIKVCQHLHSTLAWVTMRRKI